LIAAGQVSVTQTLAGFVWGKPVLIPGARSRVLLIGTKGMEGN
jgi:hypothetical protein